MKYRIKDNVVVEAVQWTGTNTEEIIDIFEKANNIDDKHHREDIKKTIEKSLTIGDYLLVRTPIFAFKFVVDRVTVISAEKFECFIEPIEEPVPQKQEAAIDNLELPL